MSRQTSVTLTSTFKPKISDSNSLEQRVVSIISIAAILVVLIVAENSMNLSSVIAIVKDQKLTNSEVKNICIK